MKYDVAIIGAGAAGLMAARTLGASGLRICLLEASDRPGGRIRTDVASAPGVPIEYGPEFVHGSPAITCALLRESGDVRVDNGESGWEWNGAALEESEGDDFAIAQKLLARALDLASDRSVDEMLAEARRLGTPARAVERTRALVAGFDAADPARASARAVATEWAGDASADDVQSRPMRGYERAIAHLARTLAPYDVTIRFGRVATGVERSARDRVVVRTDRDAIEARAAVVTIPVGVLRASPGERGALTFAPDLPPAHRSAISALAMGPVRKVVLLFTEPFWERVANGRYRDGAFFQAPGRFPTFWTQVPVRAPILTAWAGGPAAEALAEFDDEVSIAAALDDALALFAAPEARSLFVRGFTHDWQRDPFARGAYSYALVGAGDARERLARPIDGVVFFAGEATARISEGGTVAGALESGERAAREVLTALGRD